MAFSELRIVMVGKTGVGKSATGNTLLGTPEFKSQANTKSVTSECTKKSAHTGGFNITVVDTPGFFDTTQSEEVIVRETARCVTMLAPGPHAFLIVVSTARFTAEEQQTINKIQDIFGPNVGRYAVIVFTRADDLEADAVTIDEFLKDAGPELKSLIQQCGGRYHALNNRRPDDPQQKTDLLKTLESLAQQNSTCYSSSLFDLAAKIKEKEDMIEQARKNSKLDLVLQQWMKKRDEEMKALMHEIRQLRQEQGGSCTIS